MGRYDPWVELERLDAIRFRAWQDGDEDTQQSIALQQERIARNIRTVNLHRGDDGEPETRQRDSTYEHDMQIIDALATPLYAHQLAARLGEDEYTLSNILKRLRRQGYVTRYGGKWKAIPYDV